MDEIEKLKKLLAEANFSFEVDDTPIFKPDAEPDQQATIFIPNKEKPDGTITWFYFSIGGFSQLLMIEEFGFKNCVGKLSAEEVLKIFIIKMIFVLSLENIQIFY